MAIILFDNQFRKKLSPLTLTKAVADLRTGILRRKEWWQLRTSQQIFIHTTDHLQLLYTAIPTSDHIWVDASLIPDDDMLDRIVSLDMDEALADVQGLVAGRLTIGATHFDRSNSLQHFHQITDIASTRRLEYPQDVFQWNDEAIRNDFKLLTQGRASQPLSVTNQLISAENIFLEEGAMVEHCLLNAATGPIYIGKDATLMEGCMVRGPFAICAGGTLKMGAKVYGATTIGTKSVGGGEIKNSIISDFSNKAHDGYLGDSVIGEWCNLGAGTSNSNVKNTGGEVKLWNHHSGSYEIAGQKCGVIMGDYSRTAINSSINTGSIIGVCCNVFGEGLLPKLIHDFTWGTKGLSKYEFNKALQDISNWKKMKQKDLTKEEITVLEYIFQNIQS